MEESLEFLRDEYGTLHAIVGFDIFTNGSYEPEKNKATWAVIVLVQNVVGTYFLLGYFGGEVIVDNLLQQFLGCAALSSFSAEVSGLFWAMTWRLEAKSCAPIRFHVDNLSAVMKTQPLWAGTGEAYAVRFSVITFAVVRQ